MSEREGIHRALQAKTPAARQRGVSLTDVVTLERPGVAGLTWGQRLDILDAWSQVLDGIYAHLPLKRALYGFDPIRALAHLREQVPTLSEIEFHRELTVLINRLRDAHTQYYGPRALVDAVATLPFLVESFGPPSECRFVVSKVSDKRLVDDSHFVQGVTLDWWNGIPFGRAVDVHAERQTGGRPDARRARALESLTFRALEYGPPPDEHWVQIGYTDLHDQAREIRFPWRVVRPNRAPTASGRGHARRRRAIDPAAEAVRRAKKLLFNVELWTKERRAPRQTNARARLIEEFADFLSARTVVTSSGTFGYLRIWSFDVDDDDRFIEAAIALLRRLPNRGLIVDLRDNPGGFIWAAERMLQLFTPTDVAPTKFALRATPMTAALAAAPFNREELGAWADSLASAPANGEPYSIHLPITPVEKCNDIRQRYGGPIVVVVDANTYSSGDLFAAGVVDNRIGPVVCIGQATGAGGANVWGSDDIAAALDAAGVSVPPLAANASFTVSRTASGEEWRRRGRAD